MSTPTLAPVRLVTCSSRPPKLRLTFYVGGLGIAGEDDSYDFGSGAGFYVNATKEPYNKGYNMYSYITEDLPKALFSSFKQLDSDRVSITGHSMGGHGALTLVCFFFPGSSTNGADPNLLSSSRTPASTSPFPHSLPSPTPAIATGVRRPSLATSARTRKRSGLSTMPPSSSRSGRVLWICSSMSYVFL